MRVLKKLSICISVSLLMLVSTQAFADQCAYVSKEEAKKAVIELVEMKSVKFFCEPCGDAAPKTVKVKSIGMEFTDYEDYWQVQVNGKGIDLAYTFMADVNVAKYVECPAEDVSTFIKK